MTKLKDLRKLFIDRRNRKRLTNRTPTLISSNCTAGVLYHCLGLEFRSPFINLWLTNDDFVTAMENFDDFLATPLTRDTESPKPYPVGIGFKGVRIYFLHYSSWEEAIHKWEERKKRIDRDNMAIMLTNLATPGAESSDENSLLRRFEALPFPHKIVFTSQKHPEIKCAARLPGWKPATGRNVFDTHRLRRDRYIDSYDYVGFINSLTKTSPHSDKD